MSPGVTEEGRLEFGQAVDRLLTEQGRGRSWLGAEVARIEGSDEPISGTSVSKWVGGNPPNPRRVFAIEEALGARPGSLSRLLGYLPSSSRSVRSVPAAIDADLRLTVVGRRVLLKVYEEFVADGPDGPDA